MKMQFDVQRCKTIAMPMQMQGLHGNKKEKWNTENLLRKADKKCRPEAPIEAVNQMRPRKTRTD